MDDKTVRVMQFHQNMTKEVGLIAHSCGVHSPRDLRRHHARIVGADGCSTPLDQIYPDVAPGSALAGRASVA